LKTFCQKLVDEIDCRASQDDSTLTLGEDDDQLIVEDVEPGEDDAVMMDGTRLRPIFNVCPLAEVDP
jgi:hypothetical protein